MDASEYDTLREEYERNDYNDKLVQALNRIGDEDREILIRYIANRFKTAPTANGKNTFGYKRLSSNKLSH